MAKRTFIALNDGSIINVANLCDASWNYDRLEIGWARGMWGRSSARTRSCARPVQCRIVLGRKMLKERMRLVAPAPSQHQH